MRKRGGARVFAILCLAGLLVAPGISRSDTIIGKALRAGPASGAYCFTGGSVCPLYPVPKTRIKLSLYLGDGIFALGGKIYIGHIAGTTYATITKSDQTSTVFRVQQFSFSSATTLQTIAGTCFGTMTKYRVGRPAYRVDLTCTGQITGGRVDTAKVIVLGAESDELYDLELPCLFEGGTCDPGPPAYQFDGLYLL